MISEIAKRNIQKELWALYQKENQFDFFTFDKTQLLVLVTILKR